MKNRSPIALLLIIGTAFNACTKSSAPDRAVPVDSSMQHISDTAYLKKTVVYYTLVPGTLNPSDSQRYEYQYDANRHFARVVHTSPDESDTMRYIYTAHGYTSDFILYQSGVLREQDHSDYYLAEDKTVDSLIISGYSPGVTSGKHSRAREIHWKNQNRQDTLMTTYYYPENNDTSSRTVRYWYTGKNLDSAYYFDAGYPYRYYYDNGNLVSAFFYTGSMLNATGTFLHSQIPSGGFYDYQGDANLISKVVNKSAPGSFRNDYSIIYTYTFDSAGRVATVTSGAENAAASEIQVYTYY